MAKAKRNWIQEERRKTLGNWFPHEPPPPLGTLSAGMAYAGVNPAAALGLARTAGIP